ncbi:MAG: response regulator [Bdellovibrionota bacterium]|nr:response regulator [Bdellovibrionota bacterium]
MFPQKSKTNYVLKYGLKNCHEYTHKLNISLTLNRLYFFLKLSDKNAKAFPETYLIDVFKSKKILIVDDNEKTIQLLGDYLKSNGDFNTTIAKNGKQAVERALSFKPNIILMDINMPVMDGVEACRKIKKLEDLRDVPIIFLTAQNSIEEKVKALEAKGSDFITKPFYEEELILRLKLHLEFADSKEKIKIGLKKTNEMLDNIGQSFFWIDLNGNVLSPSSRTTDKVMGKNIEGQSILNTLYKDLEKETKSEITSFLEQISTIKKEDWENIPKKLPSKINYFNEVEKGEKTFHANYKPFWDDKNILTKIMFILDDKTEIDYLINQKNIYSIKLVSSITGVQENTLRTWERRYKAFTPFRDSKGKRFYNESELERVKLIKSAIDLGIKIGSLAQLNAEQLEEIIEKTKIIKLNTNDQNKGSLKLNLEECAHNINLSITNKDNHMLGQELSKLSNYSKRSHLSYQFFPLMFKGIKEELENGNLTPEQVRSITTYFKFYLGPLISQNKEGSKKVIISFFENPYWELEVFQTALICLENNLDVIFCNAEKRGKEIADHFKIFQADFLVLSCGSQIESNSPSADEVIQASVNEIEDHKKIIITGNLNYSENNFLKYENLFPLPTIKNLDSGLKKIIGPDNEALYKKSG